MKHLTKKFRGLSRQLGGDNQTDLVVITDPLEIKNFLTFCYEYPLLVPPLSVLCQKSAHGKTVSYEYAQVKGLTDAGDATVFCCMTEGAPGVCRPFPARIKKAVKE